MVQLIIIIVIIISLVTGMYSVVLLGVMRKRYQFDYLNSFFYYQILHFLFGLYGILGNLAVQQILLKFDLKNSNIEVIALFFPFFGVPFIIAAWYLFIKLASELVGKKVPQFVAITYFVMSTLIFFVYGRYLQQMPAINYQSFIKNIITVFYLIDFSVAIYFSSTLIFSSLNDKKPVKRIFQIRFGVIVITLTIFRAISMNFAHYHWIIGLYYLILFFAGNLSIILLTKVYLSKYSIPNPHITSSVEDIYLKYGISNREKEIIREICKGKTNQQIADDLFISLQTVKDHTYHIFKKVDVKNRVQLSKIFNQF